MSDAGTIGNRRGIPPTGGGGAFDGTGHLVCAVAAHAPGACVLALALLLSAAVTEAFGLALIVPLLYVTGLAGDAEGEHPMVDQIERAAAYVGVELTLPTVLILFLALAALRTAAGWQRQRVLQRIRRGFVDRLREELYGAVAAASWGHLARWRPSDIHHTLTVEMRRVGQGVGLLFQMAVGTVLALAQFGIAAAVAPGVSAGALCAALALALLTGPLIRRARRRGAEQTAGNRKMHAVVADFLGGLKLVKSYNAESLLVGEYRAATRAMRRNQLAATTTAMASQAVLDMGAACTLAALVFFAVTAAELPLPELLLVVFVFARLMPALLQLQQFARLLAETLPAYVHAMDVARRMRAGAEAPIGAGGGGAPLAMREALTVRGVSFAYAGAPDRAVLTDVDMRVPAGGFVAVMGPSGAGKSTLAHLLLGLLEPCEGEICIDAVPLTGTNVRRWRATAAFVPQEPYLFHETLRANLQRADPRATDAEMQRVLALAAALDFVDALPRGLDTVVGERGAVLSGGERQRIALAQALLRRPALLVLDEATAQLDADTECRVLEALSSRRAEMAVVAITHREAVARNADSVVLLEAGRVAAVGAWRELARKRRTGGTAASGQA